MLNFWLVNFSFYTLKTFFSHLFSIVSDKSEFKWFLSSVCMCIHIVFFSLLNTFKVFFSLFLVFSVLTKICLLVFPQKGKFLFVVVSFVSSLGFADEHVESECLGLSLHTYSGKISAINSSNVFSCPILHLLLNFIYLYFRICISVSQVPEAFVYIFQSFFFFSCFLQTE